jgi:hypothetical protein
MDLATMIELEPKKIDIASQQKNLNKLNTG